ncbi:MAG: hypothetical protein KAQ87_02320 [Candidatus Pacebacteria bacterium]|nr:hypothetical protein [Candidatus Paceibacterota bacterium]
MLKYNTVTIAEKLNIGNEELERRGLKSFLERELLNIKTEFLLLSFKYGLDSVKKFEELVKKGEIRETSDTREDFFRFDYLENRTKTIEQVLKNF